MEKMRRRSNNFRYKEMLTRLKEKNLPVPKARWLKRPQRKLRDPSNIWRVYFIILNGLVVDLHIHKDQYMRVTLSKRF